MFLLSVAGTLVSEVYNFDGAEEHVVGLEFFFCAGSHGAVEGEAHGFLVGILLILGTAIADGIAANGLHISSLGLRKNQCTNKFFELTIHNEAILQ